MRSAGCFRAATARPAIAPIGEAHLRRRIAAEPKLAAWHPDRTDRVAGGFYISQAFELVRS